VRPTTTGFAFAFALGVALSASGAWACECKAGAPESSVEKADALFEATIVSVKEDKDDWLIAAMLARKWKGTEAQAVVLRSKTGKRCGYAFEAGKTYFVAAMREGDTFRVTTCGLTRPIEQAKSIIEKLPAKPR
jgi:hypothetical protein